MIDRTMWEMSLRRTMLTLLHLLIVGLVVVASSSEEEDDDDDLSVGTQFLENFGYMEKHVPGHVVTLDEIRPNLAKMQKFYNIPTTGELDTTTVAMMKRPRCGVSDIRVGESELEAEIDNADNNGYNLFANARRKKRYTLAGAKWGGKTITYSFDNYTPDLPRDQVRKSVQDGLKVWSDATPLEFRELQYGRGEPDIHILFAAGEHNDEYAFDGQGGTLAHAFYPGQGLGGDAHFDDDEQFTAYTHEGTNLFFVAAHELGHSLGLGHSDVKGSLMAPYYQGYQPQFRLPYDDQMAIQELYGANPNPPRPPTRSPYYPGQEPSQPRWNPQSPGGGRPQGGGGNICNVQQFDAIADLRTDIFLFRGAFMWRLDKNSRVMAGYPVRYASYFRSAPSNVDAVFEKPGGVTVFLKGNRYWEYRGLNLRAGFPRPLGAMGLPRGIHAAFSWPRDQLIYFFRGEEYWGMHNYRSMVDTNEYPRNVMDDIPGLPQQLSAAFSSGSFTYFVRGAQYWRYNHNSGTLDRGYPRSFHSDILGCSRLSMLKNNASQSTAEGANHNGVSMTINFQPITIAFSLLASIWMKLFISDTQIL